MKEGFMKLKKHLLTPLFLAYPEFYKPFIVNNDSSKVGGGAALPQKRKMRILTPSSSRAASRMARGIRQKSRSNEKE